MYIHLTFQWPLETFRFLLVHSWFPITTVSIYSPEARTSNMILSPRNSSNSSNTFQVIPLLPEVILAPTSPVIFVIVIMG